MIATRMSTPSDYRVAVAEFTARIPTLRPPRWYNHATAAVRDRRAVRLLPWASAAGVYAFFDGDDQLRYIGRALAGTGLGSRVPDHLRDACRGNPSWDKVLDDPNAHVLVCQLAPEDAFWAPSLELFLCERFTGLVNKRRS